MSERKLIVLGTASQVPGRTRNQNGYVLRFDQEGFLFDPGEGTQRQMINFGVSVSEITKIFITHFHGDHCLGLAGIIQRISLDRVPHEVEVYYPASGQDFYERLRDSCQYYHAALLRPCPVFEDGQVFSDERLHIVARRLDHTVEAFGYRIVEKDSYTLDPDKLREAGIKAADVGALKAEGKITLGGRTFCVESFGTLRRGQRFAFIMDTGVCEAARELARDTDLCVMEATFLSEMEQTAREYAHLTAAQAAGIARDAGVKRLVLSHYSQRYSSTEDFVREASALHGDVIVAVDGQTIPFPRRKRVVS
ncbi:MAG TPA: ribonuclease Z [Deltaproteobacteria bacterium]|nr:ribonuclease Z [Deltaproteobacteria bacterium]HPR55398.1 ribonuclease Z [Deltaproteobacteria bacterium]HXK48241.1 ribonuclease Z [Deltaproteobacteria bacterium]